MINKNKHCIHSILVSISESRYCVCCKIPVLSYVLLVSNYYSQVFMSDLAILLLYLLSFASYVRPATRNDCTSVSHYLAAAHSAAKPTSLMFAASGYTYPKNPLRYLHLQEHRLIKNVEG